MCLVQKIEFNCEKNVVVVDVMHLADVKVRSSRDFGRNRELWGVMFPEKEFVTANTLAARRNKNIIFTANNKCKIGLNTPSNRLRSISNMIEKEWLKIEKESFKLRAKIHIIQNGLQLWKYLS